MEDDDKRKIRKVIKNSQFSELPVFEASLSGNTFSVNSLNNEMFLRQL